MKFFYLLLFTSVSVFADRYIKFANNLERAIKNNDIIFFKASFNKSAFYSRMMKDHTGKLIINDMSYIEDSFKTIGTVMGDNYHLETKYSDFQFIKKINAQDHVRLVFRFINRNGGFRYIEFLCSELGAKVLYFDILDQSYPEGMLYYYKKMFLMQIESDSPINKNLFWFDKIKAYKQLNRISQLIKNRNDREAWEVYKNLPEFMNYDVNARVQGLGLYFLFESSEEYAKELFRFYRDFKNYNVIFGKIILIEHYVILEKFSKALEVIDSLDERVGYDEYLDFERATVYFAQNDLDNTESKLDSFLEVYPHHLNGHILLFRTLCRASKFSKAIDSLKKIELNNGRVPMLKFDPEYEQFLESDAYLNYIKS